MKHDLSSECIGSTTYYLLSTSSRVRYENLIWTQLERLDNKLPTGGLPFEIVDYTEPQAWGMVPLQCQCHTTCSFKLVLCWRACISSHPRGIADRFGALANLRERWTFKLLAHCMCLANLAGFRCMRSRFAQPAFSRCGNQILCRPTNEAASWPFSPKGIF